ncbi:MAG: hypothetical protein AAGL97_04130 [Pseudomonadota bacterium]
MAENEPKFLEPAYLADILQAVVIHKERLPAGSAATMIELIESLCVAEAALRRLDAEAKILSDSQILHFPTNDVTSETEI